MENDIETLEQQTAPESTRGLFDPPEQTVSGLPGMGDAPLYGNKIQSTGSASADVRSLLTLRNLVAAIIVKKC